MCIGGSKIRLITLSNCWMFVNDKLRRNANNNNNLSHKFDIFVSASCSITKVVLLKLVFTFH